MQTTKKDSSFSRPVKITGPGISIFRSDRDSFTDQRTGDEFPKYKQAIQNRENATTELWGVQWTTKCKRGYLEYLEGDIKTPYTDDSGGFTLTSISGRLSTNPDEKNVATAAAKCIADYYNILRKLRAPLQGQVVLGELRETLHLLRNPFKTGVKLMEDLLTRRYNTMKMYNSYVVAFNRKHTSTKELAMWKSWLNKNTMKNVGDLWLELRFGVLPLMADVQDALMLLAPLCQFDDVQTYKAYGKSEVALTSVRKWSGVYGVEQVTEHTSKDKAESIIRFGYRTKVSDATQVMRDQVTESFLNIRDLPSTAWELLPWSFFIDYFVNVGSIIESAFESQENVVWNSRSDISTLSETANGFAALPIAPRFNVRRFSPSMYQVQRRKVHRYTAPVAFPPLVFSLPRSNIRLANIAALLTGFLNRDPIVTRTYK